jgi:hypothetical protein
MKPHSVLRFSMAIMFSTGPLLAQEANDKVVKPAKEKRICHDEEAVTGSVMTKRICHTAAVWSELQKQNRRDVDINRTQQAGTPK